MYDDQHLYTVYDVLCKGLSMIKTEFVYAMLDGYDRNKGLRLCSGFQEAFEVYVIIMHLSSS